MIKSISGEVIHGEKLWRVLWFPTANIAYTSDDIDNSVFHINIVIDDIIYRGMWSYMVQKRVFEAHIFDFDSDIYGKKIEVILLEKVRDNRKFDSLEDLKEQIWNDKKTILQRQVHVLTFWSFDVVHKGHEYYLRQARKYGTHLTTIVAHDYNIESIKWQAPQNTQSRRIKDVENMWIACEIIAWKIENPLSWIWELRPDIICLWYDQRWPFVDLLQEEIDSLKLLTQIIRIPAFDPQIYKSSLLKKKRK